jgi:hypothetical protein
MVIIFSLKSTVEAMILSRYRPLPTIPPRLRTVTKGYPPLHIEYFKGRFKKHTLIT